MDGELGRKRGGGGRGVSREGAEGSDRGGEIGESCEVRGRGGKGEGQLMEWKGEIGMVGGDVGEAEG